MRDNIIFDAEDGQVTNVAVRNLQVRLGFQGTDINGDFESETRIAAKRRFYFDFEAACRTIPGTTSFVQPDGSVIEWTSPAPKPATYEVWEGD